MKKNLIGKGVYYNKSQDNLMIIIKSKEQGLWDKKTNKFRIESIVDFCFYRDDENKVKTIRGVFLEGLDNLHYLGVY